MKNFLKRFIIFILKQKVKKILHSKAKIIAVTGSMGKTTAKNAIAHILRKNYHVLVSPEGFNTPLGILLTLAGEHESGFSSPWKWMAILWRVLFRRLEIPDVVVLEFGVDKPGDMDELLDVVKPHYAVVTNIAPMHLGTGQFHDISEIATEKMKLPIAVPKDGVVILNCDNHLISEKRSVIPASIISYGTENSWDYFIKNMEQAPDGITFELQAGEGTTSFSVPFFGTYHALVLVPAIILGKQFDISPKESVASLRTFFPPPGRGRMFAGVNNSRLWDSSYNSGPVATNAALQTLIEIPARRRLALLGNMNELGQYSEKYHRQLGQLAARTADEIFFVGEESVSFEQGVSGQKPLRIFENAEVAAEHLQNILREGDLLLVKGSQNKVFLERAVKKLLANPEDAKCLCRQGKEWEKK